KRLDDAAQQFKHALTLDGDHARALIDLAALNVQMNQPQQAADTYRRLSAKPLYKTFYGLYLLQSGKTEAAVTELERVFKRNPDDGNARALLVQAYLSSGNAADANKILNVAITKNPKDTKSLLTKSQLLLNEGKIQQAQN